MNEEEFEEMIEEILRQKHRSESDYDEPEDRRFINVQETDPADPDVSDFSDLEDFD